jgi:hypothetical protein
MQMVRFWTVWICTRGRTFAPFGLEPSGMVGMRLVVPWLVFDRRNLRRRGQPFDAVDLNIRLAISSLEQAKARHALHCMPLEILASWLVRWRIAWKDVTNTRSLLRTPGAALVAGGDFGGRDGLDTRDSPLAP